MTEPAAPKRRRWPKMIPVATGALALSVGAGMASADSGGGVTPDAPDVRDVQCVERCAGVRTATEGSRVQLSGASLESVDEVIFAKQLSVHPTSASANVIEARVPAGAETGRVGVSAYGLTDETEQELEIVPASQIPDSGDFKLSSAQATPRKSYYDGLHRPTVSYLFQGGARTDVRIEVVDQETGQLTAAFLDQDAEPNTRNVAEWDGRTADGRLAPNGDYKFRVGSLAAGKTQSDEAARFSFHKFRHPLPAKHSYGDGFGAGRNHQGQDVFARCGAKLFAARGGRVQWNKTHSAAGNYLVIDGKGTQLDFMYAHLRERSPLKEGDRVRTGQPIGAVGDTGNASGCHLHFEVWSGPGWYEGGEPLPAVTKMLKTWDVWS